MSKQELLKLAEALKILKDKQRYRVIDFYFPDIGPYARDKYKKHMELMRAGSKCNIRAFIGGNGTGKSIWGSIETYFHLSGKYPSWWEGKRFTKPIKAWICARENKQLRDSIQEILFGSFSDKGSGIIPKEDLLNEKGEFNIWAMAGTANCVGSCLVKHYDSTGTSDGYSQVEFKTYAQGWQEFQGATRQWIWLDEEPDDPKIYSECLARTRGPKEFEGSILCTFTPLLGYSTVYLTFLPDGLLPKTGIHPDNPNKFATVVTWDDIPHLTEEWKLSQIQEYKLADPNSIDARTKGVAAMGSGKIFPVDEEFIQCAPFNIPEYWPRAFGLDFGWHATACVWITQDPITNIKYIYAEYERGKITDSLHVQAIKSKGEWIPGGCDPHSGRRDGGELRVEFYRSLGLDLTDGASNPMAGNALILHLLESGSLKIFNTCPHLITEIRTYRYDNKDPNKVALNQDDHELDASRYVLSVFDDIKRSYEDEFRPDRTSFPVRRNRDSLTGY